MLFILYIRLHKIKIAGLEKVKFYYSSPRKTVQNGILMYGCSKYIWIMEAVQNKSIKAIV